MPEATAPEQKVKGKIKVEKKKGPVKKFFKSFIDVKKWIAFDEIAANVKVLLILFGRLYSRGAKAIYQETYAEAVKRLYMTDEQLDKRKRVFLYSALFYLFFDLILLFYLGYLLLDKHFFSALVVLFMVAVISLLGYRDHFWYMQMQKKKLGYNFHDWVAFVLRRNVS